MISCSKTTDNKQLINPVQSLKKVESVATIKLADGTFINNAPSDRSWVAYNTIPGSIVPYLQKDTLIIDDSDISKITYYGNWKISTGGIFIPSSSSCHCSWSQSPNDSLVFKFTNTRRFEWYGELMEHHGIVDLYWEDQYVTTIDTYGPNNIPMYRHWFIDNLDTSKVYKFKLIATGNKNVASTGHYVVNHGFMLINTIPDIPIDTIPPIIPDTITFYDTVYIEKIRWIDSINWIDKDTTIYNFKDSTVINYIDKIRWIEKDSLILHYDTLGSRIDTVFILPKKITFELN